MSRTTPMSWLDAPAGREAEVLSEVGWVLIAGATVVFLLTMASVMVALHRRGRAVPTAWWLVGAGIAFPTAVVTALLGYATRRGADLERESARAPLVIAITGHLWWWELRYRHPTTGAEIVLANELHLPAGAPVHIGLTSADVIHSFWVPTLGGKMDLVPGRVNRLAITPRGVGVHRGVCAEYCGLQHARMALHVVVQEPAEFERWLARQAQPASAPAGAALEDGRRAFVAHGCAGCHAVRGVAEGGALGPDLTHVGSRLHLGAGTLPNDAASLRRWIVDVQAVKPGARMPAFGHLDGPTVDALAAYLAQLQ
jgi:cytochrome c oxidase subunit 2